MGAPQTPLPASPPPPAPPPPPPPPPQQQLPLPPCHLRPQLQPRCLQAAPPARSRRWTATPACATPTASTSAAPSPARAAQAQQQRQQQQQLRRPPQRARCPPGLLQASPASSPSPMEAPPSQAAQNGFMAGSTRASCGAAPRLTRLAPM